MSLSSLTRGASEDLVTAQLRVNMAAYTARFGCVALVDNRDSALLVLAGLVDQISHTHL